MLIIRNYYIQLFLLVHFQVFCVKGADQVLMIALPEGFLHVLLREIECLGQENFEIDGRDSEFFYFFNFDNNEKKG